MSVRKPVARWDAAALQPGGGTYERMTGKRNPLGGDWSYTRDLIPIEVSREFALSVIDQVTPDDVRATRFSGTPEQAADQLQPYVHAGTTHLLPLNCADLVLLSNYSPAVGASVMRDLWELLLPSCAVGRRIFAGQ